MKAIYDSLVRLVGTNARAALAREGPLVVAITGSVGKSTTKQMVAALLRADDPLARVRASAKNYNNELGLPLTIFAKPAPGRSPRAWASLLFESFLARTGLRPLGIRTFVLEMGADHPGDLAYLTSIAPPSISVVTAVTPEDPDWAPVHAANYPSVEAVAREKATLVRCLPKEGTAVLNADDPRVVAMRHETSARLVTFGTTEAADVEIVSARVRVERMATGERPTGLEVQLRIVGSTQTVFLPGVFGRSIAFALAAAAGVGLALDRTPEEMLAGIDGFRALPGRTRLIPGIKGTTLLDDSYNASPVAVLAALRDLAAVPIDAARQRRIACLGEMRELGPQAEMLHERVGMEAARLGLDFLVLTGTYAEACRRAAVLAGFPPERCRVFDDVPELGLWVQEILRPGDLVLLKASEGPMRTAEGLLRTKGVRMERVARELMEEPARARELLCRQEPGWFAAA